MAHPFHPHRLTTARAFALLLMSAALPALAASPSPALTPPVEPRPGSQVTSARAIASVGDLRRLAANGSWDELYLSTASVQPERYPVAERVEVAKLLLLGANAPGLDQVLALSLAEIALRFEESDAALDRAAALALALGDQGAATQYLDQALARRPNDDRLKLQRAHLARAQRDWAMAGHLYAGISAASPEHASAQQALAQLAIDRADDEARAVEGARRDLLRRRVEVEAMAAALPVSHFELCRAHTIAACEAMAACKKLAVNCALLIDSCPSARTDSGLPRAELAACSETLSKIGCEAREAALAELSGNLCRGLNLRTEKRLLPEGTDGEDAAVDERAGPRTAPSGDFKRLLEQIEQGI